MCKWCICHSSATAITPDIPTNVLPLLNIIYNAYTTWRWLWISKCRDCVYECASKSHHTQNAVEKLLSFQTTTIKTESTSCLVSASLLLHFLLESSPRPSTSGNYYIIAHSFSLPSSSTHNITTKSTLKPCKNTPINCFVRLRSNRSPHSQLFYKIQTNTMQNGFLKVSFRNTDKFLLPIMMNSSRFTW